jgi:hypothetical protein
LLNDDSWYHYRYHEAFSKLCRCLVLLLSIVHDNVLFYRTENNLFYVIFFLKASTVAATAGRPMNETVPTAASRKRRIALPGGRFNKTSEVAAAPEPAAPDLQAVKVRPVFRIQIVSVRFRSGFKFGRIKLIIIFWIFKFIFYIQHCFASRSSDFTVSEDAGIESRTVAIATLSLTVRHSNQSRLDFIHSRPDFIHYSARFTKIYASKLLDVWYPM